MKLSYSGIGTGGTKGGVEKGPLHKEEQVENNTAYSRAVLSK
jgi:hypothetical protein